ncbi:unnamed protein product [Cunninghamella blakesleeana]
MEKESQWSDFYDLLLCDTNTEETEDEWTSIEKTTKGNIKFQSLSTLDELPLDLDTQKSFHKIISQIGQRATHQPSWDSNIVTTDLRTNTSLNCLDNKKIFMPGSFLSDEKLILSTKSITRLLDTQTRIIVIIFFIHIIFLWLTSIK